MGGEIKIKRKLGTAAGVLLILMLASGAQAATVVLDETDFIRGTETRMFPFEIVESGLFKATLTDFEFLAPFDVLALAILKGKEIVGDPLLGSGVYEFQADPGSFTANVLGVAGSDSDLSLFRAQVSSAPIPAPALLFGSGLIALIALRRQRS
jgi:hypothetical protein